MTLSFQAALKSALREDPDCILVGEMRDLETIRLAMSAAETGHLVFGTLHTSSAAKTIDRIIDVFPRRRKGNDPRDALRIAAGRDLADAVQDQGRLGPRGGARNHDRHVGIRNLIREAKVAQMYSAIQTGSSFGMQTLDQNLQDLVKRNVITPGEAPAKPRSPRTSRVDLFLRRTDMERDQASKFINDLLKLMVSRNGLGPVHHARLPARHQGGRQGHQGVAAAADGRAHAGAGRARS